MEPPDGSGRTGTATAGGRGSAGAILASVVDYAGLFPPAALSMPAAVAEYVSATSGPDAWILGRFVLPAARLREFAEARAAAADAATWPLSAVVQCGAAAEAAIVEEFNAAGHLARVDSVESRPASPEGIDWLAETFRRGVEVYVEVPAGADAVHWLERVAARGLRAKVRTGGVTPDAFPESSALLAFLEPAVRLRVPFKATAGLHHPVRGTYRLTYAEGAAAAPMYGYLNVLLATAALRAGFPVAVAEDLLRRADAGALGFAGDALRWGRVELPLAVLEGTRRDHFVSFGSCSFREPVDEFHALSS